jgi:hypothetical protein
MKSKFNDNNKVMQVLEYCSANPAPLNILTALDEIKEFQISQTIFEGVVQITDTAIRLNWSREQQTEAYKLWINKFIEFVK